MKYRLNRKNASGTYDTIHYETSSNIVLRPSGRTVEQDLEAYLPRTQSTDDVPQSLEHGEIVVTNDRVYIGDVNGNAMEVVTLAHELNIGSIGDIELLSGKTIDQILDLMVEKGIGIANPGVVFPTQPALGGIIDIGDYEYRIVEIDDVTGIVYVALAYWQENTQFGSNTTYSGSTIANKCTTWYNNEVPQELKDKGIFIDVVVNSVTAPCFIPSREQVDPSVNEGTDCFDFFRTQGGRVFRNASGSAQYWWTSTANSSGYVWSVYTDGALDGYRSPSISRGFRPCLAIARSAFSGVVSASA